MRRMRAEQIRYHFGRNFLPLRGMCCFNLIRYGTYQGDESTPGIGDVLPDTRAPLCPPPLPQQPSLWLLLAAICHHTRKSGL